MCGWGCAVGEVGRLWNALADHFIRLNQFEKARDVCEEGMMSVTTVRDFSLVRLPPLVEPVRMARAFPGGLRRLRQVH